jgi:MarR family 2-MHQ and catechol resistance regulon transcriptional repressor
MHEFATSDDGRLHEVSARDIVGRLQELFPSINPASIEAQLMIERSHRLLANQRDSHWSSFGLTPRRFILLRLLYTSAPRRRSMGDIVAQMHLSNTNVTQLIDGLVRDGLVQRESAAGDKRVVYAVLTEHGEELFEAVFPQTSARIMQAWARFTDEEKLTLIDLLARLRLHLIGEDAGLDDGPAALPAK